jgi:DNA gyrase subunit A
VQEIIRRTDAVKEEFARRGAPRLPITWADVDDEDLIAQEDMVVTVSHSGYIKRVPLTTYRAQRRGGKGRSGMQTRDEDFVTRLFVADTPHAGAVLLLARHGYKMKVWKLPLAARRRAARRWSTCCR